jgi:hypothetical protein
MFDWKYIKIIIFLYFKNYFLYHHIKIKIKKTKKKIKNIIVWQCQISSKALNFRYNVDN